MFVATHVPINLPDAMHMRFPPRLVSTAKLRILQCAVVATKSSVLLLLNHSVSSEVTVTFICDVNFSFHTIYLMGVFENSNVGYHWKC